MFKISLRSAAAFLALAVFAAACSPSAAATQLAPADTSTSAAPAVQDATATPTGVGATATSAAPASQDSTSTPASASSAPAGEAVFTLSADKTEARYRVREQLASRDAPSDAIGKTSKVTGSVALKADGTIDQANSKFTVDAASLATDIAMRDGFVRRAVLQTDQYPTFTFVPTKVEGLTFPLPASGQVTFKLTGDLTIRNVTKPVTWDVTGNLANGGGAGTATTSFTFEDFSLTQPKIGSVLSIADKITLEVDVNLTPAAK